MKIISKILICTLLLGLLAMPTGLAAEEPLNIVTTIFPPYDFVRAIAGGVPVELTMLLSPGAESHSFEPTPRDIIRLQNCDVFIYAGGEGDAWLERILESVDTSGMILLPMMDMVTPVEEEHVEGMDEDGHDHDVDPEHIYDRPLSDWSGTWKSLAPALADGSLDAYVQHKAEDKAASFEEALSAQEQLWKTEDFTQLSIEGDLVLFETAQGALTGAYDYAGYALLEGESGVSVWYQYVLQNEQEEIPKYLIFNDHGYGEDPDSAVSAENDEDHGVPHTHMRYGNESLEALVNTEGWNPFFVEASASQEEILETLLGHGSHSHEGELDEHVWTSPANAALIAQAIAQTMMDLDPANSGIYAANLEAYLGELDAVDMAFREIAENAVRNTLLVGDRFPFRYLADAYGFDYYAAFAGCSTRTDASAGTIAFLVDKAREEQLPVIFKIELSSGNIATSIAESVGATVLEIHSGHNLTRADFDAGVSYLDILWRNVEALKQALQ